MAFDADRLRQELEATGALLVKALRDVDPSLTGRHHEPGKWSLLEIAGHLLDEERLDFGARTRRTLDDPTRVWDPIDPESWVSQHDYASWDYAETIDAFAKERATSVAWLASVGGADWTQAYAHPHFGPISAGDLLAGWVAHDLLHLAQVARTRVALMDAEIAPHSTRYASP